MPAAELKVLGSHGRASCKADTLSVAGKAHVQPDVATSVGTRSTLHTLTDYGMELGSEDSEQLGSLLGRDRSVVLLAKARLSEPRHLEKVWLQVCPEVSPLRPAALSPEARTRTFSLLEVFAAPRFQARVGAPGGGGEGTGEAPRRLGTGAEREP